MSCVAVDGPRHHTLTAATTLTTPTTQAPEVMLEGQISKAADVYAFGVLLWELFTGGHPFKWVLQGVCDFVC